MYVIALIDTKADEVIAERRHPQIVGARAHINELVADENERTGKAPVYRTNPAPMRFAAIERVVAWEGGVVIDLEYTD